MGGPLTELRNQRLPRRKMAQTYGKKKTGGAISAHRELFGSDENQIDAALANLSLESSQVAASESKSAKEKTASTAATEETITRSPIIVEQALISKEDAATVAPLLSLSGTSIELFTTFSTKLTKSFHIEKIGEGSFAEVFRLTSKSDAPSSSSSGALPTGGAIIKVIPLKIPSSGDAPRERLSSIESVVREIKVFRTLDSVHGFTRFRGVRLVTGAWPGQFLGAFRKFRKEHKKRAMNSSPEDDFEKEQIYALVEMNDAGTEISTIRKPSVFQVYDIFWMTTILLANAEEKAEFEHRDLHTSNICVKTSITEPKEGDSDNESVASRAAQPELDIDRSIIKNMTESDLPAIKLGLSNLKITIIDYTIARCLLTPDTTASTAVSEVAYDNMRFISDLPAHSKDKESNYQFLTYRKSRAAVQHAKLVSGALAKKWKQFVPRTNVCWLAYLLKTLSWRSKGRALKYYVIRGSSQAAKALQEEMWDTLATVEEVVTGADPEAEDSEEEVAVEGEFSSEELERTPASAGSLLVRAVEEGWLSREEVEAFKERLERES